MQDRFKFRVWDTENQEYLEFGYNQDYILQFDPGCGELEYSEKRDDDFGTVRGLPTDALVIEQCTGLKDKNGNLIYEGDICFCKTPGQQPRYIVFVYNAKYSQMQFRPLNNKQKTDVFSFSEQSPSGAFPFEWLEIIGNIHTTEKE